MKNSRLLLIAICCLCIGVDDIKSQITVTLADYASVGDLVIRGVDTLPPVGINVGSTGPQNWDFSTLQNDYIDSIPFVDPNATPAAADFLNSNLAYGTDPIYYQTSNASGVSADGNVGLDPFGAGTSITTVNNPTHNTIEFPSTIGSSFSGNSRSSVTIDTAPLGLPVPNVDSMRLIHYSTISSAIDAFGDVTTPTGTYSTLRQLFIDETLDSIWAYCSDPAGCNVFVATLPFGWGFVSGQVTQLIVGVGNPSTDTSYVYKWWANGEDLPVVEIGTDVLGGSPIWANYITGTPAAAIVSLTNVLCIGDCNGTAEVLGVDGNTPYTYLWDDLAMQTTSTGTGLCAGAYTIRVINSIQDTTMVSLTIGSPLALSAVLTSTADSGASDGTATITVSGGSAPYTYAWDASPVQTQATAIGLSAGIYSVTVTDANGCVYLDSTNVSSVTGCSVSASFAISSTAICKGQTITFTNTSSGASSYNWLVDNNSFASAVNTSYTFTSGGSYDVILVAIDSACTDSVSQTVTVNANPPIPTVTELGSTFSCDVVGGNYQWFFNSDTIQGATNQVYIALQTGFYQVAVIDVNGCSSMSANIGYTGIENQGTHIGIAIYPNPSNGQFTVELNLIEATQIFLKLYDITGAVVFVEYIPNVIGNYKKKINLGAQRKGVYYLQILTDAGISTRKILMR